MALGPDKPHDVEKKISRLHSKTGGSTLHQQWTLEPKKDQTRVRRVPRKSKHGGLYLAIFSRADNVKTTNTLESRRIIRTRRGDREPFRASTRTVGNLARWDWSAQKVEMFTALGTALSPTFFFLLPSSLVSLQAGLRLCGTSFRPWSTEC